MSVAQPKGKRHRWGLKDKDGYVECLNCGLKVKKYKLAKGGFMPCEPGRWKIKQFLEEDVATGACVYCPKCGKKVPNTRYCINCSNQLHPNGWKPS